MKIALAQMNISWEDKDRNIISVEEIISKQADNQVEFVFLPEMSFTGFSMNVEKTKETGNYTRDKIVEIARRYKVGIGYGWVKDAGEKCMNMYSVISKEGELLAEYAKMHPFSYSGENQYFLGGNGPIVFDVLGIPFSIFICYDLRFPEVFRKVCKEAHVIVIPANWPERRRDHWNALLKARAIENQVYILGVNCYGDIGGNYYSGDSCVIDPYGRKVMDMKDREGVLLYDLKDDVDTYRKSFPVLDDIID